MKTILLVDDEELFLLAIRESIKSHIDDISVLLSLDGKQAVQVLDSAKVDLVITDLNMPVMNGFELIAYMSRHYAQIPVIVMTASNTPEIQARLDEVSAFPCMRKPPELNELMDNIAGALELSSKGYIQGFTLPTFLQAVAMEQKTCTLEIRSDSRVGYLYLKNGNLIDAETDGLKGKNGAIEIVSWDNPEIHVLSVCKKTEKAIESSLMNILLEAARRRDERNHGLSPPDTNHLLAEAIRFAEGLNFPKAQEALAKLLKTNPRNHSAWLWYSRIAGKMKTIETSLKNASLISPKDSEIIEETEKFELANERITAEQVRRCPFCWSPLAEKTVECHYCNAHLFIHKQFFTSNRLGSQEIINGAIKRYQKITDREKNTMAHYYLAMAYLNLEKWEDALHQLDKSVKLAPEKRYLSDQLRILLDHMASSEDEQKQEKPISDKHVEVSATAQAGVRAKKVLVVEDSSTTRKVVTITLSQNGYEVIEARDGLEALSRVNEERPDLILLDILLPKMDGYKILSILKDSPQLKHIPVIMLTSKDGFFDKVKGKLAGSSDYLTKPFDPKKLVETVERNL